MSARTASNRYARRFTVSMLAYAALLIGSVWVLRNTPPAPGAWRYLFAVAPALPLLATIWAMGAYLVEEADEFKRAILAQAMLWGIGITLSFTTVWGFLEENAGVPHFPLYLAFPVFCAGMGVAQVFVRRAYQ